MLATSDLGGGEQREVLEAYRMFAQDTGWLRRIREAIGTGLSAEAAVRRVQEETRVRIGHASDPYLRERLIDLDDIANRLLRHLVGKALQPRSGAAARRRRSWSPATSARRTCSSTTAASCAASCSRRARKTAHVTIVARAIGIPMLGRIEGAMAAIDPGNPVALDGDNGHRLRPAERRGRCRRSTTRCGRGPSGAATSTQIREPAVGDRATASRSRCRSMPPS